MANTEATSVVGTVIEVRKMGDTAWKKFVCNDNAFEIDYGESEQITYECLESGEEKTVAGTKKYSDIIFEYVWTQALTNEADSIVKAAHEATNTENKKIEVRLTMDNATTEATGTTYVIPFIVLGYKHKGEAKGVWKTETKWKQIGQPTETAAQ